MLDRPAKPLEGATNMARSALRDFCLCRLLLNSPRIGNVWSLRTGLHLAEEHAHDNRTAGISVFYDGTQPILWGDEGPLPAGLWMLSNAFRFQDGNTRRSPVGFAILSRLAGHGAQKAADEMLCMYATAFVVAPGVMHMFVHPDWTPVPDVARYGQTLHTAIICWRLRKPLLGPLIK